MITIAKTELTETLEKEIIKQTSKQGVFGCLEVTLGWYGKGRVDYMTMDTKDIFRCYEIKISKSDFHSKHGHNFVGHYNYYVMPEELYNEIKNEIPKEIGVYTYNGMYLSISKRPKKQELKNDINTLKNFMIRSLYRDIEKARNSQDINLITRLKSRIENLKKEKYKYQDKYTDLTNKLWLYFGREEYRKLRDKLDF